MNAEENAIYLANVLYMCEPTLDSDTAARRLFDDICTGIGARYSDRSKAKEILQADDFQMEFP